MKKQRTQKLFGVLKGVFNVRQWTDYDRLKSFTFFLGATVKKIFVLQKVNPTDAKTSFKEAVAAMNMTKEDLNTRKNALYRLCILMVFLGLAIFAYAIYQLVLMNFAAGFVSVVVSSIAFMMAFRYHFWYFQIKEQKLGCTLKEWYEQGLLGKKP